MIITNPTWRARARAGSVLLAGVSACMFGLSAWSVAIATTSPAAAAVTSNGAASISPGTGNSATAFSITLDKGANPAPSCPGDSASGGYRWQTFMVPSSLTINGDNLQFSSTGPITPSGFKGPLYGTDSNPVVNMQTDIATGGSPVGAISGIPSFDFAVYTPGDVPAGSYTVGVACTKGVASPTQLVSYWSTTMTVTTGGAQDGPAHFTWATTATPPTTSPTTAPTTAPPTTAPTTDSTTATTVDPTTSTTASGSTTSSTSTGGGGGAVSGGGTSSGGNPTAAFPVTPKGTLPYTGNNPWTLAVWGALLLVFGRMAVLLARKPKVIGPTG